MATEKYDLILERPSPRAVRLANDIYFTYLYEESSYLRLSLPRLCEVFGISDLEKVHVIIDETFQEINEPIVLSDCTFKGKHIEWQVLNFFNYSYSRDDGCEYVEIEINEFYLEVLSVLDKEPYINFQ